MENEVKRYRSGNYIIGILFVTLLGMLFYCAKIIEQDRVIFLLSLLCASGWVCLWINSKIKTRVKRKRDNLVIEGVKHRVEIEEPKEVESDVPDYIMEEEKQRINIMESALESLFVLIDENQEVNNTAIAIKDNGILLTFGYMELYKDVTLKHSTSTEIIMGKVIRNIKDSEGNDFSLVAIPKEFCINSLTVGSSDDIKTGSKVYSILTNEVDNIVNIVEGIVSNVERSVVLKNKNNSEIFKHSKCFLYSGAYTEKSIGGPLIDVRGNLVGIILGKTSNLEGINHALPIDQLQINLEDV